MDLPRPFEIENEAALLKQTGKMGAIVKVVKLPYTNLAPILYGIGD